MARAAPEKRMEKVEHQLGAGGLHGLVDAQAVGRGHGHRLLEEEMLAGLEGGDGQVGM